MQWRCATRYGADGQNGLEKQYRKGMQCSEKELESLERTGLYLVNGLTVWRWGKIRIYMDGEWDCYENGVEIAEIGWV